MKILIGVDGSAHSQEAIDEVIRRPWPNGTVVRLLSAVQTIIPPAVEFAGAISWQEITEQHTKEAEHLTARLATAFTSTGLKVETKVRQGDPRSEIISDALEWGADLIVVGSHGHTRLERLLVGSVAHSIINHAPCSVEIVRRRQSTQPR